MTFPDSVTRYRIRYLFGLFLTGALRWIPGGAGLAILVFLFSLRMDFSSWLVFPALLFPSAAAGAVSVLGHRKVMDALSWLDNRIQGKQELQSAWESRHSEGILSEIIIASGRKVFDRQPSRVPRPTAGAVSVLFAMLSLAVCLMVVLAGDIILSSTNDGLTFRGAELEAWAEVWARESGDNDESRELADRMGRLGRRMASGEMGEARAERALRELGEEIEQRQEDLQRDKIAESLVNDLNLDKKSAEAFRVGKKRLPSDVLSDLGAAVTDSTILSSAERELMERLLSDPDLRDQTGRGRPELTEQLTRALDDMLETDDPLRRKLDEASKESVRARIPVDDTETPDSDTANPDQSVTPGPAEPGTSTGQDNSENESGDLSSQNGRTGGSGRGSVPVTDEDTGSLPPLAADRGDNSMRLPSGNDGSGSWKTVIRAYGESGEFIVTPGVDGLPPWTAEVESVIGREEIPPGVRDYVREYFLALEAGVDDTNESSIEAPVTEYGASIEE